MRIILLPPDLSGAALAELKSWLAIGGASEDALLLRLLAAAHDGCARFTGLTPIATHYREAFGNDGCQLRFATRPLRQIVAVRAIGEGLAVRSVADTAWRVAPLADGGEALVLAERPAEARIEIDYAAGLFDDWAACNAALREGMLRFAAHLYTQRDPAAPQPPPAAIPALWRPWRRVTL